MKKFNYLTLGFILGSIFFYSVSFAATEILNVEILPLKYYFNGIEKEIGSQQKGFIYNGKTYVPLRFLSEALGKDVNWDESNLSIYVQDRKESNKDNIQTTGNSYGNVINRGLVCKNEDWIYYISSDNWNIYKQKLDGSNKTRLVDYSCEGINVVNDWIYYSNGSYLYRMRTDGSQNMKILDKIIHEVNIVDDWIYYSEGVGLYRVKNDGSIKEKLCDGLIQSIYIDGDWVYFIDGSTLKKLNIKKPSNIITIAEIDCVYSEIYYNNEIYYITTADDTLYSVKMDGTNKHKIGTNERAEYFNIDGDWIYYTNEDDNFKLYKIKTDGTGKKKISDTKALYVNIMDDWIYFQDRYGEQHDVYRIKKDGTGQELVQ